MTDTKASTASELKYQLDNPVLPQLVVHGDKAFREISKLDYESLEYVQIPICKISATIVVQIDLKSLLLDLSSLKIILPC